MIAWTDSARALLDRHNQAVRAQLRASGADPDEVAADLRRHIEEELLAAKIHVAAAEDVQRILARLGVAGPDAPAGPPRRRAFWPTVLLVGLVLSGAAVALYQRTPGDRSERPAAPGPAQAAARPADAPAGRPDPAQANLNPLDWTGYSPAQRTFYGIGSVAALLIVILGLFQLVGLEIHPDLDHPDHNGASLFSVKPIIGFFFGLGWAGGVCSGRMALLPAVGLALGAGLGAMVLIWAIVHTFVRCQNDGSMQIQSAVGKEGVVYTTVSARGGLVQVALNTGLETLPAVTQEAAPISTGKTVTVIRLDGPNLLVETKKT